MTPTQRSKKHLEALGYRVAVVERWNPHARIRQDLFNFGDLYCVHRELGSMIVQVTSSAVSARLRKIREECRDAALDCLHAGVRVEVHGWAKRRSKDRNSDGTRSKRSEVRLRVVPVTIDELQATA